MVKTRSQRARGTVSESDSDEGSIPPTTSRPQPAKNGNGPTLRPGKQQPPKKHQPASASQTKRKRPTLPLPALGTPKGKRPKRAAPSVPNDDGDAGDSNAALAVINSFSKPRSPHMPQKSSIVIPLANKQGGPTGNEDKDGSEGSSPMDVTISPMLGGILPRKQHRPEESHPPEAADHDGARGHSAAVARGKSRTAKNPSSKKQVIHRPRHEAIRETPQLSDRDVPITSVEPLEQDKEDHVGEAQDDVGDAYYAMGEPSPELGSSQQPHISVYEFPEDSPEKERPAARPPPPRPAPSAPGKLTINGLASRSNAGRRLVPKPAYHESTPNPPANPRRVPASLPTITVRNKVSTGRPQSLRPLISGARRSPSPINTDASEIDNHQVHEDEEQPTSPGRQPTPRVDDDGSVVGRDSDDQDTGISGHNDSLMIQAPTTTRAQHTVTLSSQDITRLFKLMGDIGWTELNTSWSTDLLHQDPFDTGTTANNTPALTKTGKQLFKILVQFKTKLSKAPAAPEFGKQNGWLRTNQQDLSRATDQIDRIVTSICETRLAVMADDGDSEGRPRSSGSNLELRSALTRDLVLCVIPMLVQALWSAFSLGGLDDDDDDDDDNFGSKKLPDEGEFTSSTLQYLARINGWLVRLDWVLMYELSLRPCNGPGFDMMSAANKRGYPDKSKKKRAMLRRFLTSFGEELKRGTGALGSKANREVRRREQRARQERIRTQKWKEEEDKEVEVRKRWDAMARSLREMRRELEVRGTPNDQEFRKVSGSLGLLDGNRGQRSATMGERARTETGPRRRYFTDQDNEEDEDSDPFAPVDIEAIKRRKQQQQQRGVEVFSFSEDGSEYDEYEDDDDITNTPQPGYRHHRHQRQAAQPRYTGLVEPPLPPPPFGRYEPWDHEDKAFLLDEIRRADRPRGKFITRQEYESVAEALEKPLDQVLYEAAGFRWAARALARERGVPVEEWGRER